MRRSTPLLAVLILALAHAGSAAAASGFEGPVKRWIVLGPFENPQSPGGRGARPRGAFDLDSLASLGGEAQAVLTETTMLRAAGRDIGARVVDCSNGELNFIALYPDSDMKLAYAYAEVRCPADQDGMLYFGSDDGAKVWLNGQLIWDIYPETGRAYTARQDRIPIKLKRGGNRLLVKVENGAGDWMLGAEVLGNRSSRAIEREQERAARERESLGLAIEPVQGYPGWVFEPGPFPRIGWRDPDRARELLGDVKLKVRWFNARLEEVASAASPGRYMAVVEGTLRDGAPLRQALTCFCKPPNTLSTWLADWGVPTPYIGPPLDPVVWRERGDYVSGASGALLREALLTTGTGAEFLAGMFEAKAAGRAATFAESPEVVAADARVALRRKLMGLTGAPSVPAPHRSRANAPAPVIREGAPAEAGVRVDAKAAIDAACAAWAKESGEPFSLLVARHGVIITHAAFGDLRPGQPCATDFRFEVASITKAISGILFSQFVDQGIVAIDDPIGKVLPGFPTRGPHAITYRHCFTHTTGFDGHGEFGGIWNPYLDCTLLRWLPRLKPGTSHLYNGMGYDLVGKAMETLTGKSVARIFNDHLFTPLGFTDVPIFDMAFGARLTARELAVLGQWLANKGSYGDKRFISESTFGQLLPRPLRDFWPPVNVEWGIGLTHMPDRRAGAPASATDARSFTLGPRTIGHGSATSCVLRVDPDQDLVIAMIRRTAGRDYDRHLKEVFAAVADSVIR